MKSTVCPALVRLAVMVVGVLSCGVQQAQSQDHVFANPPMLSSRDGRLDVDLVAASAIAAGLKHYLIAMG